MRVFAQTCTLLAFAFFCHAPLQAAHSVFVRESKLGLNIKKTYIETPSYGQEEAHQRAVGESLKEFFEESKNAHSHFIVPFFSSVDAKTFINLLVEAAKTLDYINQPHFFISVFDVDLENVHSMVAALELQSPVIKKILFAQHVEDIGMVLASLRQMQLSNATEFNKYVLLSPANGKLSEAIKKSEQAILDRKYFGTFPLSNLFMPRIMEKDLTINARMAYYASRKNQKQTEWPTLKLDTQGLEVTNVSFIANRKAKEWVIRNGIKEPYYIPFKDVVAFLNVIGILPDNSETKEKDRVLTWLLRSSSMSNARDQYRAFVAMRNENVLGLEPAWDSDRLTYLKLKFPMKSPKSGSSFEKDAIVAFLKFFGRDPSTDEELTVEELQENIALKDLINYPEFFNNTDAYASYLDMAENDLKKDKNDRHLYQYYKKNLTLLKASLLCETGFTKRACTAEIEKYCLFYNSLPILDL